MPFVKNLLKSAARNALRLAERTREPTFVTRNRILGIEKAHGIHATALLQVTNCAGAEESHLELGAGTWLGERVEIEAVAPGFVEIGERTSLQNDCVVRGHVTIGADCIFARGCLVISTAHHFRDTPEWLISDQDDAFREKPATLQTQAIRIGEDCWVGACCAIMAGVTVGRGAVIGANTVVTRDIGPYEIHCGSPNRLIGQRLSFTPPHHIDARNDQHIPYFYEGFRLKQKALSQSRPSGVIAAGQHVCFILESTNGAVEISGRLMQAMPLSLKVRVNGRSWKNHAITGTDFILMVMAEGEETSALPGFLQGFTVVELHAETAPAGESVYGIAEAKIV